MVPMAFCGDFSKAFRIRYAGRFLFLLKKRKNFSAGRKSGKTIFEMTRSNDLLSSEILEEGRSDTGNEIQEFYLLRAEYFCGGRADALAVRLERGFNIMKENKSKVIITSIVTVFPIGDRFSALESTAGKDCNTFRE